MEEEMKFLFMSGENEPIEKLSNLLQKRGIKSELGYYIGYRIVRVPSAEYERALTIGAMYVGKNKTWDVCWISPDDVRMHNIDVLAIEASRAVNANKMLDDATINKLAEAKYSTLEPEEFDE